MFNRPPWAFISNTVNPVSVPWVRQGRRAEAVIFAILLLLA